MKVMYFGIGLLIVLISGITGNKARPESQQWQLTGMSGGFARPQTSGDDMQWQESYTLYPDNIFKKTRTEEDQVIEGSGSYTWVVDKKGQAMLELTYLTENPIIGNCNPERKEYLDLKTDSTLVSTWFVCDGPGLSYKKIQ